MYPYICHIYGPLYLNCYGLAIFLGISAFAYLIERDKNFLNLFDRDKFSNFLFYSVLVGIAGGRLLYVIEDYNSFESFWDIFKIWQAGFSFLGTMIALLIFGPIYLKRLKVNVLLFLDVVAIYAPLTHSISRIGCFLAGCCQGIPTDKFWGVVYTHPEVLIPDELKFIKLHPTQLYSSILLFIIFCLMYFVFQYKFKTPGQLLVLYVMLTTSERFFIDFFRSDREFFTIKILNSLSMHQWISIIIFILTLVWFMANLYKSSKNQTDISNNIIKDSNYQLAGRKL